MKKFLLSFDYYILIPTLILIFLSFFVLSSFQPDLARSQAINALLGLGLFLILSLGHPVLYRGYAYYLYIAVLMLLIAVYAIGEVSHGANRWIPIFGNIRIQPSEFAKPILILSLAKLFSETRVLTAKLFLVSIGLTLVYFILVYKQPDLGTAMMFIFVWGIFLYLTDIPKKVLFVGLSSIILISIVAGPFLWGSLHDYQRNRVLTFIEPERDPLGTGYNVLQSMITVGSGGFFGKGFGQGTQSHNNFLPEQYTDFAFATYSEEFGFLGVSILFLLYSIIIWRIFRVADRLSSRFAVFVCMGVVGLMFFQIFINIGMNVGIVPVAGITLPFFSYGGSSLISFLMCLGLVEAFSRADLGKTLN
ncbi:MAG: rod shape-determining protein RodA [bacterium]|nr:rod shape-determining protein RodA [bacterium]